MSVHVTPLRTYLWVFLALVALTGLTTAVAFVNLGVFNNVVALGIAGFKATLVVLFFMHVRGNTRLIPLVIVSGLVWLSFLLFFTLADYASRGWFGVPGR